MQLDLSSLVGNAKKKRQKGNAVIAYLLFTFSVIMLTTFLYVSFTSTVSTYSENVVIEDQIQSISGTVTTNVEMLALLLPSNSHLIYNISYLPSNIAGKNYYVDIRIGNGINYVDTMCSGYSINFTSLGVGWEINGTITNMSISISRYVAVGQMTGG